METRPVFKKKLNKKASSLMILFKEFEKLKKNKK